VTWRSAVSSSSFPPLESRQGALVRRHRRCFPPRARAPQPPISLPPAHLRPSRPHRCLPGELPVP
jgi:hypothetical protein